MMYKVGDNVVYTKRNGMTGIATIGEFIIYGPTPHIRLLDGKDSLGLFEYDKVRKATKLERALK